MFNDLTQNVYAELIEDTRESFSDKQKANMFLATLAEETYDNYFHGIEEPSITDELDRIVLKRHGDEMTLTFSLNAIRIVGLASTIVYVIASIKSSGLSVPEHLESVLAVLALALIVERILSRKRKKLALAYIDQNIDSDMARSSRWLQHLNAVTVEEYDASMRARRQPKVPLTIRFLRWLFRRNS